MTAPEPSDKALARDPSASHEDWQKLARTGEIVWFYNGRERKTVKILRFILYGHFGWAVSESWLRQWASDCPELK